MATLSGSDSSDHLVEHSSRGGDIISVHNLCTVRKGPCPLALTLQTQVLGEAGDGGGEGVTAAARGTLTAWRPPPRAGTPPKMQVGGRSSSPETALQPENMSHLVSGELAGQAELLRG